MVWGWSLVEIETCNQHEEVFDLLVDYCLSIVYFFRNQYSKNSLYPTTKNKKESFIKNQKRPPSK